MTDHPSPVSLREITFATVRQFLDLDVAEHQRSSVASNARSIAEAHFNPGAWLRGIYRGDTPVGLILLLNPAIPGALSRSPMTDGDVALWRFMIDLRHQKHGYGKHALDLARSEIRRWSNVKRLMSSYVPGEHGPEQFYLRYGFQKTGGTRANGGEIEIWMTP